jgi:tetratricopeptide (TPR) repeat protein
MDFPDSSVQLMEEALDSLPRDDSRLRVRLLAHLVRAKYFGDEREQLVDWAREAVAIATRLNDPGARFAALEALHYALLVPAHLEERLAVSSQLPELARQTGSIRFEALGWLWRAFDLLQVPDIVAADVAIGQFEDAAHRLRQPFYEWLGAGLRATRALMEGRLDEAERIVFRAFELGQRADSPNALSFFGTQLFHLREAQGRADELMVVMQKIVDESPALPVFRIGIPLIHALADRREEALRSFEQVAAHDFEDVPHDLHRLPMLGSAAAVCAYLGDERRAEILLRSLRPEAGRIVIAGVATYWAGSVDQSLGQLEETVGRLDEAENHYAAAAEVSARAGARLLEARALADRARVLRKRKGNRDLATAQTIDGQVAAIYRDLGIAPTDARSASPTSASDAPSSPEAPPNRFFQRGRAWLLEYEGIRVELPDSKGLGYLQRLVSHADEDVHVVDLISPDLTDGAQARVRSHGLDPDNESIQRAEAKIEVLDPSARQAYRERLEDLSREWAEAEHNNDLARQQTLGEERDLIESELRSAFGLSGRARSMSDPTERARKSVYNRVRASIDRITREHSSLGRHLRQSIRTGTTCSYRPDRPVVWVRD